MNYRVQLPAVDPETGGHLLTPRLRGAGGTRLALTVDAADYAKVRRGPAWRARVTDLATGKVYILCSASCGIPSCRCDAVASLEAAK